MPFNRLDKLVLLLTSGILFYSFLVDFILRMYKSNPWINLCIRLQEHAYWVIVIIVIICVVIISLKNTDRSNARYFFKKFDKKNLIFVAALLILSSVRLLSLDAMPLHLDESDPAFWPAKHVKDYGLSFFRDQNLNYADIPINSPRNLGAAVYIILCSFNMHFFKNPVLVVRVVPAVIGILTIILTFFLVKDLYGLRVGLLSSLFLALFPWHVLQSRVGFNGEILVPLFGLLIFYLFNKSLKGENAGFLFLTSIFLGIGGLYIYVSSLTFLVIILFLIIAYYKKLTCYGIKNISLSILIFLLFLYPHLAMMYNQDYQLGRITGEHTKLSLVGYTNNIKSEFKIFLVDYGADAITYFQYPPKSSPLLGITLTTMLILAFLYYTYRKEINLVFLIWLVTPVLCVPMLDYVTSRYLLSLLPIILIFISKFLNDFAKEPYFRIKKRVIYRRIPSAIAFLIILLILFGFIYSLTIFFQNIPLLSTNSPYSLSKHAIEFLFEKKIKDDKFIIFEDALISVSKSHVWYLLFLKGDDRQAKDIEEHILPRGWGYHPTTGTWTNGFPIKGKDWEDFEKDYLKKGFTIYYLIWGHSGEDYYNQTGRNEKITETGIWLNPFDTGIPSPGLELFNKIHKDEKPIKTIAFIRNGITLNIYEITPQGFKKNN